MRFDPPLPVDRALLMQRMPAGSATKFLAMYEEPFWRADGLCGQSVGLTDPIWAAAPPGVRPAGVGTVNVVAWVPARLSEAALVNAVATVAEAKVQALVELEVPGTGTCTDATVLACPTTGPVQPYGGPRSDWGAPLARAVYAAVLRGGRGTFGWPGSDRVRRDPPLPPGTNQT